MLICQHYPQLHIYQLCIVIWQVSSECFSKLEYHIWEGKSRDWMLIIRTTLGYLFCFSDLMRNNLTNALGWRCERNALHHQAGQSARVCVSVHTRTCVGRGASAVCDVGVWSYVEEGYHKANTVTNLSKDKYHIMGRLVFAVWRPRK